MKNPYTLYKRGKVWHYTLAGDSHHRTIAEARARADVFDYIEVFYNRKRRHEHLGGMSPVEFEQKKLVA
jgi:transposase InsO family protein